MAVGSWFCFRVNFANRLLPVGCCELTSAVVNVLTSEKKYSITIVIQCKRSASL